MEFYNWLLPLPCDSQEWPEHKKLFLLLSHLRSAEQFTSLVSAYSLQDGSAEPFSRMIRVLEGLGVYLKDFCNEAEQEEFFSKTLPFISMSASSLEERAPANGIPFLRQQEAGSLVLGRKLIASLLANGFLCTFPLLHNGGESPNSLNFTPLYNIFLQPRCALQSQCATKLKCFIHYFERVLEHSDIKGVITLKRQVIHLQELPSISDWLSSTYPLCPVVVDTEKAIENAGSNSLQVVFSSSRVGGGVLGGGCAQEELRVCMCPELLVAMAAMDEMQDNEAVVVSGVERFSTCKGYGDTLEYGGDWRDRAMRDVYGNAMTSVVAIDASNFTGVQGKEQYSQRSILRELNKAYTGFVCQQSRGDLGSTLLSLSARWSSIAVHGEEDGEEVEKKLSSVNLALGNINIPSEDSAAPQGDLATAGPVDTFSLSTIQEVSETPRVSVDNTAAPCVRSDRVVEDAKPPQGKVSTLFLDELVGGIISRAVTSVAEEQQSGTCLPPQNVVPVKKVTVSESPHSSRSSSLTGQSLTFHEFTDSLVEMAVSDAFDQEPQLESVSEPDADEATAVTVTLSPSVNNGGPSKGAGSAMRLRMGNLLQERVSRKRRGSGGSLNSEGGESEKSTGSLLRLNPSIASGPRMSNTWSIASTRDEDSRPVSPSEMKRLALGFASSTDEFVNVFSDMVVSDAIADVATSQQSPEAASATTWETNTTAPVPKGSTTQMDSFLSTLDQAEPVVDGMVEYSARWHQMQKRLLRSVATGNWGSGGFSGDPQLKSMIQWMAVSISTRPRMIYYPFGKEEVSQLSGVVASLCSRNWTVGSLCQSVLAYAARQRQQGGGPGGNKDPLFSMLLKQLQ